MSNNLISTLPNSLIQTNPNQISSGQMKGKNLHLNNDVSRFFFERLKTSANLRLRETKSNYENFSDTKNSPISVSDIQRYSRLLMSQENSQRDLQKLQLLSQINRSVIDASLQPLRTVRS